MSIIAFDGYTIAADKQATCGELRTTATKLKKLKSGEIVGFTGALDKGVELCRWYESGAKHDDYPKFQEGDEWTRLVVVKKGKMFIYEQTPTAIEIVDEKVAFGGGRDFAIGAMDMGADAIDAVNVASKFCVTCGMGVDSFVVRARS